MAAAIGAGALTDEPRGYMVLDIAVELPKLQLYLLMEWFIPHQQVGGDTFDDAIIGYVRRNYGCVIGYPTAEKIKHEIGCAYPSSDLLEIEVKGTNLSAGVHNRLRSIATKF